jgi:hypothetical protein
MFTRLVRCRAQGSPKQPEDSPLQVLLLLLLTVLVVVVVVVVVEMVVKL